MNINDVKPFMSESFMLKKIFDRQKELMEKYHPIEKSNGLLQTEDVPVNLHDRFGQARLKDFAWRVTEEIGEATASLLDDNIRDHFFEEIADSLHFLVELMILSNVIPKEVIEMKDGLEFLFDNEYLTEGVEGNITEIKIHAYNIIEDLTRAMNCLKQKPWKQTHMETDVPRYSMFILCTFVLFIRFCKVAGMTPEILYSMYFRKSEVNRFRQRSNY